MVNQILKKAAVPSQPGRYPDPPACTYAIWFDSVSADGSDDYIGIFTHDISVELYESVPDDTIEAAVEAELNARGIPWIKQPRYWLPNVQRYQVVYEFTYTIKI